MKILIVNGMPRSGKSSFCQNAFEKRGMVYYASTIDPIKRIAMMGGWSGGKTEKDRRFLSDLKDLFSNYNDLPHRYIEDEINARLSNYEASGTPTKDVIFLIESREPKDIQFWEDEYGARSVLVSRPGIKRITSNHADADVGEHKYHYHLLNTGTEEEWKIASIGFIDKIRNEDWWSVGGNIDIWDLYDYK